MVAAVELQPKTTKKDKMTEDELRALIDEGLQQTEYEAALDADADTDADLIDVITTDDVIELIDDIVDSLRGINTPEELEKYTDGLNEIKWELWLDLQRAKFERGLLEANKVKLLDANLPGWRDWPED
ncbi:hypothetical protein [Bifidobacterium tibiigranuli]|uniref:hypothetical protein n=1 Tax=Bifidobacterium tibiigranuli TaxID=2172043 RepID=UPI0026F33479|nr:hypothetical protein [Bifidobacterium tibiigranuli]MCI2186695.1 hypothetical protein [Bifidobacterium tibiigranuli]MCI2204301.1 hypothetical protein [Bifidobacterium tibiigranuli]